MNSTPFRVEFDLCAPIQTDFMPIHLDGLIAYALFQEEMARFSSGETAQCPNPADVNSPLYDALPLARESGVYCASVVVPVEQAGISSRYFIRSSDAQSLALIGIDESEGREALIRKQSNQRVISTSRGALKTCFITEQVVHASLCVGYAVGDLERVEYLLKRHVFALGKNRAKGFGSVSEIRVVEDSEASTVWQVRALPGRIEGYVPMVSPVRPPYWNKSLRQIAYLPPDLF